MAWNRIDRIAVFSLVLIFAACGGGDDKSSATEPSEETSSYASKEDLPNCTSKRETQIESTDDGKMYVCYDESWKKIDYTESEVDDLPSCTEKRNGSVAYLSSTDEFIVCKNEKWQKQTPTSLDEPKESSSSVSPKSSSGNSTAQFSSSSVKTNYIEVKTKSDLIECNTSNKEVRALILADSSYYTCNAKEWKKDGGYIGYDVVADRENLPMCNAGNAKQRVLAKKDSVFFVCDSVKWEPEQADGYLVQNASILGAAHKGPFKFDSPLLLREILLRNDSLIYSGRKYVDEISSNKGNFVIPKVKMVYPYAELEVRGLWRNEISGDWSKDSMTLRVLTDLTKRIDVNINLLTHLEYDRAEALVNKGYSVYAAKKQADYEIMTALGFATTVEYSENLETFVASTNSYYEANSTLMAISLLFIGNRSDAEIQKVVDEFRMDVANDGEWNGETAEATKADMADWAESFDTTPVRANVKTWNIVDIPSYENYLTIFWNNAYGLGGCASTRYGVVAPNTNKSSKNYNEHYICDTNGWRKATEFETDTYEWGDGKSGEVKKGNVTETYYVFENGKWSVAKSETALGICDSKRSGEIGKVDVTYYACFSGKWSVATELQYDTYQFGVGKEGEVRKGKVNTGKYYVYENGSWRVAKNEAENTLGACLVSREGEIGNASGKYYICKSKNWDDASMLEYDTYGWTAGTEGEVKPGNVYVDNHYVYENGSWRACNNDIEYDLGACVTSRVGEIGKSAEVYYMCKSSGWTKSTALEYDTYGWKAGTEGEVRTGSVNAGNFYVYENGKWRASASTIENDLGACVTTRNNEVGKSGGVYYTCKSNEWTKSTSLEYDTYGWAAGTDGELKEGNVDPSNHYVYENGKWREADTGIEYFFGICVTSREGEKVENTSNSTYYICEYKMWKQITALEYEFGYCSTSNEGFVGKVDDEYYICKSKKWTTASVLEYDTYQKVCSEDGAIVGGEVIASNKYVCDADMFRVANETEISLNKGCVSYTEDDDIRINISEKLDSVYTCINRQWIGSIDGNVYGTLLDDRDEKTYKTVVIGKQTWMAENLNYADSIYYPGMKSRNWCCGNDCVKYGRLYTWAAAIDSAGTFSSRGKGCGDGKTCSKTYPVRGICPIGWHLPNTTEWEALFSAVGGKSTAGIKLKSTSGWPNSGNGTDAFSFSALPAGYASYYGGLASGGGHAHFWSSIESGSDDRQAYRMYLCSECDKAELDDSYKQLGFSVRCVKD